MVPVSVNLVEFTVPPTTSTEEIQQVIQQSLAQSQLRNSRRKRHAFLILTEPRAHVRVIWNSKIAQSCALDTALDDQQ
jgi:hypothetical protein